MRVLKSLLVALSVLLVVGLTACGSGSSDDATNGGGDDPTAGLDAVPDSDYEDLTGRADVTIDARDNTFEPQYVTVSPGTKVEFDNVGRNPHNAIAVVDGAFEDVPTDELQPGDVAVRVFDEPGDYPYYCSLHGTKNKGMTGRVRVADQ
ncbi:MAG: cupredoxin domain-containing protein [Microthrixaceae bacterium]